jgi:hypothetical protein
MALVGVVSVVLLVVERAVGVVVVVVVVEGVWAADAAVAEVAFAELVVGLRLWRRAGHLEARHCCGGGGGALVELGVVSFPAWAGPGLGYGVGAETSEWVGLWVLGRMVWILVGEGVVVLLLVEGMVPVSGEAQAAPTEGLLCRQGGARGYTGAGSGVTTHPRRWVHHAYRLVGGKSGVRVSNLVPEFLLAVGDAVGENDADGLVEIVAPLRRTADVQVNEVA